MDYNKKANEMHEIWKGKIEVISRAPLNTTEDLSVAYTPGVAQPCREIHADKNNSYKYTRRGNLVAVISDGSAVLGLGNIGAHAAMPVMEGKCILLKKFADVDAFPICLDTQNTDELVATIKNLAPSFGGINLEDISAPRCFEVERRLKELVDIPVFHDDQHGTAIVVVAALINSLKLAKKTFADITVCISGCGAAGTAITKLLLQMGAGDILITDSKSIINRNEEYADFSKNELKNITNKKNRVGGLKEAIAGADVFVGVSKAGLVTADMVKSMNHGAIVFAMANPTPEIFPDEALAAGALIAGSGRSDFKNQVNNVLAFPGIFRGALDCRASQITEKMKLAAAHALASLIDDSELSTEYVIPRALDTRVSKAVAQAVAEAK